MRYKKRGRKAPHQIKRSKSTRSSVLKQRRRHSRYRDLVNQIPAGVTAEEYQRLQILAAEETGI